jgi:hypothetical protein
LTQHPLAGTVTAARRGISNLYSRIPLRLMAEFAREGGVAIKPLIEDEYSIPRGEQILQAANEAVTAAVKSNRCTTPEAWVAADPSADPAWHRALRHAHLHFSARYNGIGHTPEWSGSGSGFGRRQRGILNG